ncbi:hypothetical protein [Streptomyces sp. NPDC059063]|uniref:hypothetical protein n=1 Tax=Streptomyces sp. NPDC059063 TaxID=3346712 RepID=UPI00369737B6
MPAGGPQAGPRHDGHDGGDPGEQDVDGASEEADGQAGEEPGRRALAMPDLRPYIDPRPLAELGLLAVEVGQNVGPPLLGRLTLLGHRLILIGRALAVPVRGLHALLALLTGWLSGKTGKRGSFGARLAGIGFGVYAVLRLCLSHPAAPWGIAALLLLTATLVGAGRIPLPGHGRSRKTGKKETADEAADEAADGAAVEKETGALTRARRALLPRLVRRPRTEAPDPPPSTLHQSTLEHVQDQAHTAPMQAPAGPSREDVIRALHGLVGGGRGVLLTTLRRHLALPHTGAVKAALQQAAIPHRSGVRTAAGNGPGVHRDDFPPLPSPPSTPQGRGVAAGQQPTANANNTANTSPEGQGSEWTRQEIERGRRTVPDPERGPAAWKIQHYGGGKQA